MGLGDVLRVLGGVGLFLLGMRLMTDGLKLAAGAALRDILARGTGTTARGLLSGAAVTAVVQSSSAVTVAVIGFVNAGLLSLRQAVAVMFGSNVGTTMTGWLVAVLGFDLDVAALALPMVGVGMFLRTFAGRRRSGAVGEALAGFGVFFLGIDVLKTGFLGLGESIAIPPSATLGILAALPYVGLGFLLTMVIQSSSAALAITLTGAAGGVIPLPAAAGMVVGANVGTTSTAALAALGATPNARRVAASHVVFNLVTGVAAMLILTPLLAGLVAARKALGLSPQPAAILALFHTVFNFLGVLLMWPLIPMLVRRLERSFRTPEEEESRPRFLDRNVAAMPDLALNAIALELARIGGIVRRTLGHVLSTDARRVERIEADSEAVDRLVEATGAFVGTVQRMQVPPEVEPLLLDALRTSRHYSEITDLAAMIAEGGGLQGALSGDLAEEAAALHAALGARADAADPTRPGFPRDLSPEADAALDARYEDLKRRLLEAGARGALPMRALVDRMEAESALNRAVGKMTRAAGYLARILAATAPREAAAPGEGVRAAGAGRGSAEAPSGPAEGPS